MDGKEQCDDCVAEFLNTIKYSAEAYSKKMANCPVFNTRGQFLDGNSHTLSDWDTQTVVCVSSPHGMLDLTADVLK